MPFERQALMIVEKIECYDKYEAEKLAGFLTMDKNDFVFLQRITTVFQNEVVFMLKDKSSHCVMLRDYQSALRLNEAIMESIRHKKRISSNLNNSTIEITIS
ncbi:hypothetical protein DYY65_08140 [Nitrososphaera sp. AFS]|nr:hypothetical protein [Nitrososphaera sp. AFS]